MGGFSMWHWIVVVLVLMLVFGRGHIARLMGELGAGLGEFRRTMKD